MPGKMLPRAGQALFLLLGGGGSPPCFLEEKGSRVVAEPRSKMPGGGGSAAISLLREQGDGPTQRLSPGQAEGTLGAN